MLTGPHTPQHSYSPGATTQASNQGQSQAMVEGADHVAHNMTQQPPPSNDQSPGRHTVLSDGSAGNDRNSAESPNVQLGLMTGSQSSGPEGLTIATDVGLGSFNSSVKMEQVNVGSETSGSSVPQAVPQSHYITSNGQHHDLMNVNVTTLNTVDSFQHHSHHGHHHLAISNPVLNDLYAAYRWSYFFSNLWLSKSCRTKVLLYTQYQIRQPCFTCRLWLSTDDTAHSAFWKETLGNCFY